MTNACPVCDAGRPPLLYEQPDFRVYRCRHCGLAFAVGKRPGWPVAPGEDQHEPDLGRRYVKEVFLDHSTFWDKYWRRQLSRIAPLVSAPNPRVLDIGCGVGQFLYAARQMGWQTVGVESSTEQAEFARTAFGLEVHGVHFEEAGFHPHSFDVVTLWNVIEHVSDPKAVMSQVRGLTKPGGLLALRTPNQGSLITWLAHLTYVLSKGKRWLPIFSEEHRLRFSAPTLRKLLDATGFQLISICQDDNAKAMLTRLNLLPYRGLRSVVLYLVHWAAWLMGKQNQLLAIARPASDGAA